MKKKREVLPRDPWETDSDPQRLLEVFYWPHNYGYNWDPDTLTARQEIARERLERLPGLLEKIRKRHLGLRAVLGEGIGPPFLMNRIESRALLEYYRSRQARHPANEVGWQEMEKAEVYAARQMKLKMLG